MENRFEQTNPEEQSGWSAHATPPTGPGHYNSQSESSAAKSKQASQQTLCDRVREMLPSLLENDGVIRPEMATGIYGHLTVCPACRQEFEEHQRVIALLEALAPAEMPMDYSRSILQRIQAGQYTLQDDAPRPRLAETGEAAIDGISRRHLVQTQELYNEPARTEAKKRRRVLNVTRSRTRTTAQQTLAQTVVSLGNTTLWQRVTLTGVFSALIVFFLGSGWGRELLGVNIETAVAWLGQIGATLRRVPILSGIVTVLFAALSDVGSVIADSYRNLGPMAARGLTLDIALCAVGFYVWHTHNQRSQMQRA